MNLAKLANNARGLEMKQVNIFDAKTDLSKLLKLIETKAEDKIIIARSGVPIAQIVPYEKTDTSKRLGIGKGILPELDWDEFLDSSENPIEDVINWESLDADFN